MGRRSSEEFAAATGVLAGHSGALPSSEPSRRDLPQDDPRSSGMRVRLSRESGLDLNQSLRLSDTLGRVTGLDLTQGCPNTESFRNSLQSPSLPIYQFNFKLANSLHTRASTVQQLRVGSGPDAAHGHLALIVRRLGGHHNMPEASLRGRPPPRADRTRARRLHTPARV